MRPLGLVLQGMGLIVSGSDMNSSVSTDELISKGIRVEIGHRAENIADADCIIRTAAVHNDNPEIAGARARGIPVFERAQAWGIIMRAYKNAICISGTHGKTTTTSMVAHILMAAQMDPSAYALVNNPNPEDRLHLRAKPDKGAHSYGKFYNRTPVRVLERGDTWTKVEIGRGGATMTGYMMTKFLAFDEVKKEALACAFPQKLLREGYPNGTYMYAEPRETAVTDRVFKRSSDDFIIGVYGDEWFVVMREDGAVGYVPQEIFWDGNG